MANGISRFYVQNEWTLHIAYPWWEIYRTGEKRLLYHMHLKQEPANSYAEAERGAFSGRYERVQEYHCRASHFTQTHCWAYNCYRFWACCLVNSLLSQDPTREWIAPGAFSDAITTPSTNLCLSLLLQSRVFKALSLFFWFEYSQQGNINSHFQILKLASNRSWKVQPISTILCQRGQIQS